MKGQDAWLGWLLVAFVAIVVVAVGSSVLQGAGIL